MNWLVGMHAGQYSMSQVTLEASLPQQLPTAVSQRTYTHSTPQLTQLLHYVRHTQLAGKTRFTSTKQATRMA